MNTPVLQRYNKTVFYTYISVVLLSLVFVWGIYNNQKKTIINEKSQSLVFEVQQMDLLFKDSIEVLHSLNQFASRLISSESNRSIDRVLDTEFLQEDETMFFLPMGLIEPENEHRKMASLAGVGSLRDRDDFFYHEVDMLYQMSFSMPIIFDLAKKVDQLYYVSMNEMVAIYPRRDLTVNEIEAFLSFELLQQSGLAANPDREVIWSAPRRGHNGLPIITLGNPIYVGDEHIGTIFLDFDLIQLSKEIAIYFDLPGDLLLLDNDRNVLIYPNMHLDASPQNYTFSQQIPSILNRYSMTELFQNEHAILSKVFIKNLSLHTAPLSFFYTLSEKSLISPAQENLELVFILVVIMLSILVYGIHFMTRRAFITPATGVLEYLRNSAKKPTAIPSQVESGWESWFELVSQIFDENRQYTEHLADQNRRLDKLVAKRTKRLELTNARHERDYSLLRSIIDAIPEVITFKDKSGRYLGCNKEAERIMGFLEADLINLKITDLDSSERARNIHMEEMKVLESQTPTRYQEQIEVNDKRCLTEVFKVPFYNRDELLGLIMVSRDITRDVEQQEQIKRSEERYHLAMDAVEDGLWDWYLDSNQIICNPAYFTMLGYEPNEFPLLIGTFYELMHPSDRQRVEDLLDTHFNEPEIVYDTEFRMLAKSGCYHWIHSRGRVVEFDKQGEPMRVLGTHKDITRQKENEVVLFRAKQDAELANRTKGEFLANMSHEIRTPMNAVLGMLHLAQRTELTVQQQDYMSKAKYSAESLLRIINDILDFSKIEAGKLDLEQTEFSLDKVLDHALSINSVRAQEKGLELLLYSSVPANLHVIGDPLRLGQILVNLLSNAVKFTDIGEIELGCEDVSIRTDQVLLKFWVRDTGIGIGEAQQRKLFDAFSQADGSTTRKFGGTGLGLSISRHLVSLMGGSIAVESVSGEGATFSFTLATQKVDAPPQESLVLPKNLTGMKALVVDDNHTALQIYSTYLRDFWSHVDTADNVASAINMLIQQPYDLILLDWMMPDIDGAALLKKIDQMVLAGTLQHKPKVIMMTAYSGHALNGLVSGHNASGLLQKPFKVEQLYDQVLSAFSCLEPETVKPMNEPKVMNQNAKILLTEDNIINQQVATELLRSAGYEVTVADNGQEAINRLNEASFDLILMDIQMPVMDGLTATRLIRQTDQAIPIIAMTAHAMAGDREKSLEAGMNDHITKPIVLPELFSTIKNCLKLNNKRDG